MSNNSKNNKYRHAKLKSNQIKQNTNNNTSNSTIKSTQSETNKKTIQTNQQNKESQNNKTIPTKSNTPKDNVHNKSRKAMSMLVIFGITFLVAILGTLMGGKKQDGLISPPGNPPDWVFPAVWAVLYVAIATATFLAYLKAKDKKVQTNDMICYGVHLFLNLLWPLFYFRLNLLIFSTIWLLFMVITAITITYRYYRNNLPSGIIFTCYTLWLLYALYLSLATTMINLMQ